MEHQSYDPTPEEKEQAMLRHPTAQPAKTEFAYKWTKVWAVQTPADNPVAPGDEILVADGRGGSKQRVLSVTTMTALRGGEYKTLLLRAL